MPFSAPSSSSSKTKSTIFLNPSPEVATLRARRPHHDDDRVLDRHQGVEQIVSFVADRYITIRASSTFACSLQVVLEFAQLLYFRSR